MGIVIGNTEGSCDCNPVEAMTHIAQNKSSMVTQEHTPLKTEK